MEGALLMNKAIDEQNKENQTMNACDYEIKKGNNAIPIETQNLSFSYSNQKKQTIENINIQITPGEFILLVGPTGSGKTTFIRCFNGLIPFFHSGSFCGYVFIKGKDTAGSSIPELSKDVGMVFQNPENQLVSMNITRELAFGPENLGLNREDIRVRIQKSAEAVNITHILSKSPFYLSGGEQQRVAIASILAMNPTIMVFDEPTSNLDPASAISIINLLKKISVEQKITIIVIEHRMELVLPVADSMIVLQEGKMIAYGSLSHILQNEWLYSLGLKIPPQIEMFYKMGPINNEPISKFLSLEQSKYIFKEWIPKFLPFLKKILQKNAKKSSNPIEKRIAIQFRNVYYAYEQNNGSEGRNVLQNLNFDIYQGEIIGIIGKNGAGKTTTVRLMNGLKYPSKGVVYILGKDTRDYKKSELTTKVGLVFQNPDHQLFEDSVEKELNFSLKSLELSSERQSEIKNAILKQYGLDTFLNSNPFTLSGGEKKRLVLASVLCRSPQIIILDEPTIGQDKLGEELIKKDILKLKEQGLTVLVITHDMDFIYEVADRFIILSDGKLVADGNKTQIMTDRDLLQKNNLERPIIVEYLELISEYLENNRDLVEKIYTLTWNDIYILVEQARANK